jgi:membrane protein YqaA with SNARE-associated domain
MLDRAVVIRLLCVAFVAAIVLPVGRILFPYVSHDLTGIQFQAIEAVLSATVGFGIYSIFG